MSITEWADVLRKSPIFPYGVAEHNNWKNNRPLGNLDPQYLVWHHDGSPPGPSPGDVDWLINAYNAKNPSAQIIIGYDGTWHFVGSGIAWHAGTTDGIVTNFNSAGTETDQTTGENPSPKLLDSVRRGYAAIFKHEGWAATRMRFHKMIARPVGRKPDPDFGTPGSSWNPAVWDQEYAREVALIQGFINNTTKPLPEVDDMAQLDVVRDDRNWDYAFNAATGVFFMIRDDDHYFFLKESGIINVEHGAARHVEDNMLGFIRSECARVAGTWPDKPRIGEIPPK